MITYHFSCSGSTLFASMNMRSRWMDEIATIEALSRSSYNLTRVEYGFEVKLDRAHTENPVE